MTRSSSQTIVSTQTMKRVQFSILMLLLGAFALRLFHIGTQPLSGDEAFTITQWGPASLSQLFGSIAQKDPQPPVALVTYHTWIYVAGTTEIAVRLLSACFSVLSVAAIYSFTRAITTRKTAALSMLLCTVAAFQIWYSQDARAYAEWMAFSLLAATAFLKALRSNTIKAWVVYIVLAALSLQTFYLEVFAIAATNLFAIIYCLKNKRFSWHWVLSQLVVAATFVPWFLYSRPQDSPYQPTASFPNLPAALAELLFGATLSSTWLSTPMVAAGPTVLQLLTVILLIVAALLVIRSKNSLAKYMPLLQILVPVLALTALSLITHKAYFRARYIATVSAPVFVTLALAFTSISQTRLRNVASLTVVGIVALSLASVYEYNFNTAFAKAPPWRDIAAILKHDALPDDVIIQNYPDPALPYYYSGPTKTIILPASENPPAADTIAQLVQLPSTAQHIWFIRVDTPFWDKQQVVATWLEGNTAYLTDTWVGGMRIYQYSGWQIAPDTITISQPVNLGLVDLVGHRITYTPPQPAAPTSLTVELYWQPVARTASELRVFVHLLQQNPDGSVKLWSQDDHPPQQGRLSTTSWPLDGTIYRDVYTIPIPADLPQGTYSVAIGFYNPLTANRYPLPLSSPPPEPNALLLASLTLPIPK